MKQVILTGLRANNDLHIGNYFGALLPMIDMARDRSDDYQINLFVPDLHSFTTPIDHSQLLAQTLHNVKLFIAAGLDMNKPDIHIYRQSYVPAHSELTWILNCFTGMGEMSRMTQFKDKSAKLSEDRISVGLFDYPVLMTADILLYGASYVPVGDDQSQHLEFARDIAERMNNRFGELFTVPEPVAKQHEFFGQGGAVRSENRGAGRSESREAGRSENHQGLRIRDLQEPAKKMSKSDESGKGIIFMGDNPDEAARKIMGAATDSFGEIRFDPKGRPGISNLLQLLALLSKQPQSAVNSAWEGKASYGDLKKAVADQIRVFLINFQTALAAVDNQMIVRKLELDEAAMNETANATLLRVQQAVGLRSSPNVK